VRTNIRRQRGATLIVTLVMLIMLTLFAISAMNTSTTNLQVVGNMQMRHEGLRATQEAIEATVSSSKFLETPLDAIPNPCGAQNTFCTDLNGDGVPDLTTRLIPAPACKQARVTKVSELQISSPNSEDLGCAEGERQGLHAVAGARTSGDSLCGNAVWEITAQTLNSLAGTATSDVNVTATQGIGVRMNKNDIASNCP
jgi:hypothetical protein